MSKEEKVSLDTMVGVGKKIELAGREYTILPVNIRDMHYILGEDQGSNVIILDKKALEKDDVNWQLFGLNIVEEKRRKTFMDVVKKYVYYKDVPMSESMLIEHNWSFKEIGKFLIAWSQISD